MKITHTEPIKESTVTNENPGPYPTPPSDAYRRGMENTIRAREEVIANLEHENSQQKATLRNRDARVNSLLDTQNALVSSLHVLADNADDEGRQDSAEEIDALLAEHDLKPRKRLRSRLTHTIPVRAARGRPEPHPPHHKENTMSEKRFTGIYMNPDTGDENEVRVLSVAYAEDGDLYATIRTDGPNPYEAVVPVDQLRDVRRLTPSEEEIERLREALVALTLDRDAILAEKTKAEQSVAEWKAAAVKAYDGNALVHAANAETDHYKGIVGAVEEYVNALRGETSSVVAVMRIREIIGKADRG